MRITRRAALRVGLLAAALGLAPLAGKCQEAKKEQFLVYVGTYTTSGGWRGQTKSKGIYGYPFDPEKGAFTPLGVAAETTPPPFLAVHPSGKKPYAMNQVGNILTRNT